MSNADETTKQVKARADEIKKQVEARTLAEANSKNTKANKPLEVKKLEISDADILAYLNENRLGDAKLYTRLHRGKIIYVKYWDRCLVWAGHHWEEDDFDTVYRLIDDVCQLYLTLAEKKQAEADEETDKEIKAKHENISSLLYRRVNLLRDKNGQDNLLLMLRRIANPLVILPKQIDKQHYIKACPNGVIDLRTGELRPGKPKEYLLNAITTEYDHSLIEVSDPCPETNAFLLRSMDDNQDLVDFIWRLLGYGLITDRKDHIFIIFWGEHGRNGKDTLIKIITHVLGQTLSGDVPVEMFLQMQQNRSSSAPSPDVLALRGMSLAWINEAEEGQRFALAKLKKLTGGGYITARGLNDKLQTTWMQTHLPIMTTNELPKAKADDNAFWQRTILLKWPLSFVDSPKEPYERPADKHLYDKLESEAQGILARMVIGAMEYLREGLKVPDLVKQWTTDQRASWDDLAQFFTDWCILEEYQDNSDNYKTRIEAAKLHEAFSRWYAINKDKRFSVSAKKFSEMLSKKGIVTKRSNGAWKMGISLNKDGLDALNENN